MPISQTFRLELRLRNGVMEERATGSPRWIVAAKREWTSIERRAVNLHRRQRCVSGISARFIEDNRWRRSATERRRGDSAVGGRRWEVKLLRRRPAVIAERPGTTREVRWRARRWVERTGVCGGVNILRPWRGRQSATVKLSVLEKL